MARRALAAIINWNGAGFLEAALESLLPQLEETGTRLVVFDNASTDNSCETARRICSHSPLASVHRSPRNVGWDRAANSSVEMADTPFVVLANNDTVFRPGALNSLLSAIESHEEAAVVGPKLLWPDGSLQPSQRDFPFPRKLLLEHLPLLRALAAKHADHSVAGKADWLVGAVLAVRSRPFLEAGGFSSRYSFFHGETDLLYRLSKSGWSTWFEPSAEVVHLGSATQSAIYGDRMCLRYIPAKMLFLRIHGGPGSLLAFRALMGGLQIARMLCGRLLPGLAADDVRYSSHYCRSALRLLMGRAEPESWDGISAAEEL